MAIARNWSSAKETSRILDFKATLFEMDITEPTLKKIGNTFSGYKKNNEILKKKLELIWAIKTFKLSELIYFKRLFRTLADFIPTTASLK